MLVHRAQPVDGRRQHPATLTKPVGAPPPTMSERKSDDDPFMGCEDSDDPFAACVLPPSAAARGVTTTPSTPVTDPPPPVVSPMTTVGREETAATATDRDKQSVSCSCSETSVSTAGDETATTGGVTNQPAVTSETVEDTVIEAGAAQGVSTVVPTTAAAGCLQPTRAYAFTYIPTDDDIVTHFVAHPEDDARALVLRWCQAGQMTTEAVNDLMQRANRVKALLASYAAALIIRRSQVCDGTSAKDADDYLRSQLYKQSGHQM